MSNLKDLDRDTGPPEALRTLADKLPDAEMREVVRKFEEMYAGLAPEEEGAAEKAARSNDIFPYFPDELSWGQKPAPDRAPTPHAVSRVEPRLARKLTADASLTGSKTSAELKDSLDIDEAISILRAAEASGKAAAERAAREAQDEDDAEDPASLVDMAPRAKLKSSTEPHLTPGTAQTTVTADADWSTRSRSVWSTGLIATSIALVVGTGVGYLMGRGNESASIEKIQSSPEGGARLRPDYNLRKR